MDEMHSFLSKNNVKKGVLLRFGEYMDDEKYDTDALKADVDEIGNIDATCGSEKLIEVIEEFIKATAGYVLFYIFKDE